MKKRSRMAAHTAAWMLASASVAVFGQAASSPSGSTGAKAGGHETTASDLPPGATSARGNKAATPAKGASGAHAGRQGGGGAMPTDPNTGSTPGMPPGATSARGDKAATPKGAGSSALH